MTIDNLISAYLDGELDSDEARDLEERLDEPEIATALARELALRDYLVNVGPEAPPEELTWQLELAVTGEVLRAPQEDEPVRFGSLRAALAGMSWMARGPALAVNADGVYGATRGLETVVAPLTPTRPAKRRVSTKRRLGSFAWKLLRRK